MVPTRRRVAGSRVLPGLLALAAMVVLAGPSPRSASAEPASAGNPVIEISGETTPERLPRLHPAPTSFRVGFTSVSSTTSATPELTSIGVQVSRRLTFDTAGLPSCPISELYDPPSGMGQVCSGSLVGSGVVISEVTIPGQAPVTIEGHLLAFYDLGDGQPRILAQVTSEGVLPLTYVIPFTIRPSTGIFGTTLAVEQMRFIAGICAPGHSNCFSQTYTFKGIYGHISKFELTLHRQFIHRGKRASLVNADCPASHGSSSMSFPLVEVNLAYPEATTRSQVVTGRCQVAAPRRHRRRG